MDTSQHLCDIYGLHLIYPIQVRAARALLGISQDELANKAGIGVVTLKRLEASGRVMRGTAQTVARIQRALEAEGVVFIDQDDQAGPGVRLKNQLP